MLNISEIENEVTEKDKQIRIMLNNTPVGLILFDENFKFIDCNEAVLKIYGVTKEFYREFFDSADHSPEYQPDGANSREKAAEIVKRVIGGEDMRIEWVHLTPDGEPLPVDLTLTRMNHGGKYVGLGYIYDMREQIRVQKEIEAALIKAQEANRAKSEFLSRMSHELRTPVNAIMGMTRAAKITDDPEKRLQYFDELEKASREQLRLIDDVLDMSGIEYGTFNLVDSVFDFNAMIRSILITTSPSADAKQQEFDCDIDPSIPETLIGDEKRLRQVIISLLINAIKYTPENGNISLTARMLELRGEGVALQFEISDNGIGISKEKQADIFNLFEQVDGSLTRQHGGIGLGLALSRRIVEMMGGAIALRSEPGEGSVFTFHCKLKTAARDAADGGVEQDTAEDSAGVPDFAGKRILVVDDLATNRMIVKNIITETGVQIIEAENGKEAVKMFCDAPEDIDLILMDIMMPVMNGYEAARKIRASGLPKAGGVPIIALTALTKSEDVESSKNAGMDCHIGKPTDASSLLTALKRFLA